MAWRKANRKVSGAKREYSKRFWKPEPNTRTTIPLVPGSDQQEAIWEAALTTEKHIVVAALAGTGKTFTTLQTFARLGEEQAGKSAFVAFNKAIATELQGKVPNWVTSSTFHSMMNKAIYKAYGKCKLETSKTSYLLEEEMGSAAFEKFDFQAKLQIEKLVGLVKNTLSPVDHDSLDELADHYDVEVNGMREEIYDLVAAVVDASKKEISIYDFDDMLWLPVVNNLPVEQYDFLAVDEAQDLNKVQQEAVKKVVGDSGRVMIVGDSNQAIYGFRGSDVDSIPNMTKWLETTERGVEVLPLTKTRRCPKTHVQLAQQIVPEFEAMEEAPEGRIDTVAQETAIESMQPGDLVVCRLNAPVVSTAFKLLRAGKRANIQGRDIGKSLKGTIRKMRVKSGEGSVLVLLQKLESYFAKEIEKLRKLKRPPESRIANMSDRHECILIFCDGCDDVEQVYARIDELFVEKEGTDSRGVLLSTVHRAKGLEADTVWVLHPELMPFPKAKKPWEQVQEKNLKFVAFTRSKDRLVMVPKPVKQEETE